LIAKSYEAGKANFLLMVKNIIGII